MFSFLNQEFVPINEYLQCHQTPVIKYIKPITITQSPSGIDLIDCIYVINLNERPEKWHRMEKILTEKMIQANRVEAINGWNLTYDEKKEMLGPYLKGKEMISGGPIGCLLSHLSIWVDAFNRQFNTIWILEDDADFIGDIQQIPSSLKYLSQMDPRWDILFTDMNWKDDHGESYDLDRIIGRPGQKSFSLEHYLSRKSIGNGISRIRGRYGTTSMILSKQGLEKLYQYFSHVYLWTALDCDIHFIPKIREYALEKAIISNLCNDYISDTKQWSTLNPTAIKLTDESLAMALADFFILEEAASVLDLSCGICSYVRILRSCQIEADGYDKNPDTFQFSKGLSKRLDPQNPFDLGKKYDWVLFLELGEYFTEQHYESLITNIDNHNTKGIIVSLASAKRDERNPLPQSTQKIIQNFIIAKGYDQDADAEKFLKEESSQSCFQNSIMVFRKHQ